MAKAKDKWAERKARMQTNTPKLEIMVDIELQKRGLLNRFDAKGSALVFTRKDGLHLMLREQTPRELIAELRAKDAFMCVPDRSCSEKRTAFFFDGPPHQTKGERLRDEQVDEWLNQLGWKAVRFPYKAPSRKLVVEICEKIEGMLNQC